MLTKKMLEDAANSNCKDCHKCKMIDFEGMESCIHRTAQTALVYRTMLERLEYVSDVSEYYSTCPICGESERNGHKPDCELAALLKEEST